MSIFSDPNDTPYLRQAGRRPLVHDLGWRRRALRVLNRLMGWIIR